METERRVGVVATLKGAEHTLDSWILFHLAIGISKVYLFFDDSTDTAIALTKKYDPSVVVAVLNDESLKSQWKAMSLYPSMEEFVDSEVQARQQLNAEVAMGMAVADGLHWLIHIDVDELFYLKDGLTLNSHFGKLESEGIFQLSYQNWEGVPEKEDIVDYFTEVTLFKRHFTTVPCSADGLQALQFWKSRTNHNQYFMGYDNGKSAVRVMKDIVPQNVHKWRLPDPSAMPSYTAIADARHLDINRIYKTEDAVILHYIVCGFGWYYKKYQILDLFPNYWFGGKLKISPCFHLDSRDVYLSGDIDKMRALYRRTVMLNNEEDIKRQTDVGFLTRIPQPQERIVEMHRRLFKTDYRTNDASPALPEIKPIEVPGRKPQDGPPSVVNTLPLDKMWVLSQLVGQYALPDK